MSKTQTPSAYAPGRIIRFPDDFPHEWRDSLQADQFWTLDRVHFDEPIPPLAAEVWQNHIALAFNKLSEQYCLPINMAFLTINGYLYTSFQPVSQPPDAVLKSLNVLHGVVPKVIDSFQAQVVKRMSQKYLVRVEPILNDLENHWHNVWKPGLQEHFAFWDDFDPAKADITELIAHMEESLTRIRKVWEIHFALFVPAYLSLHLFDEHYHKHLDSGDVFAAFQLVQEFDNSFWQAERAIWGLARQARTMPAVARIINECPAAQILAELAGLPEGQIFLAEFQAYLNLYGRRGQETNGLSETSWIEDPTPALLNLQAVIRQPDRDFDAELQAHSAKRRMLVGQTRQRLQILPLKERERFEMLLKSAQTAAYLHEEHHFWIDQQAMYLLRRVFMAVGGRFVDANIIDSPRDIFFLTLDEIRNTAAELHPQQDTVKNRQATLSHFREVTPPDALGTVPLMTPTSDPLYQAVSKVLGELSPATARANEGSDVMYGSAAAPGIVRGHARVIHSIADANRLQPGDILVTQTFLPPWTPLFATAAGVVTETGGILSHAAVLAREYGIPAIVGVEKATLNVRDGQWIEVNGTDGTLHLLREKDIH